MSNILTRTVHNPIAALLGEKEPLKWMEGLLRWDPFGEMAPMVRGPAAAFVPDFEVRETKDAYQFRADLPGVKEKDLDVTLSGSRLTIAGTREAEKVEDLDRVYAYERAFGAFTRTFTLPDEIDVNHVRGELKEGVLTVVVPKMHGAKAKKIELEVPKTKA
jgi:HSP20 family protein